MENINCNQETPSTSQTWSPKIKAIICGSSAIAAGIAFETFKDYSPVLRWGATVIATIGTATVVSKSIFSNAKPPIRVTPIDVKPPIDIAPTNVEPTQIIEVENHSHSLPQQQEKPIDYQPSLITEINLGAEEIPSLIHQQQLEQANELFEVNEYSEAFLAMLEEQKRNFDTLFPIIFRVCQRGEPSINEVHAVGIFIKNAIDKDSSPMTMESIDLFIKSVNCVKIKATLYAYYSIGLVDNGKIVEVQTIDAILQNAGIKDVFLHYYIAKHCLSTNPSNGPSRLISLLIALDLAPIKWGDSVQLITLSKEGLTQLIDEMPAIYQPCLRDTLKKDLFGTMTFQLLQFFKNEIGIQDCFFTDTNWITSQDKQPSWRAARFSPPGALIQSCLSLETYENFIRDFVNPCAVNNVAYEKQESILTNEQLQYAANLLQQEGYSPEITRCFYSLAFVRAILINNRLNYYDTPKVLLDHYKEIIVKPKIDHYIERIRLHTESNSNFQEISNLMEIVIDFSTNIKFTNMIENDTFEISNLIQSVSNLSTQRHLMLMYISQLRRKNLCNELSYCSLHPTIRTIIRDDWDYLTELQHHLTDLAAQGAETVLQQIDLLRDFRFENNHSIWKTLEDIRSMLLNDVDKSHLK